MVSGKTSVWLAKKAQRNHPLVLLGWICKKLIPLEPHARKRALGLVKTNAYKTNQRTFSRRARVYRGLRCAGY